MSKTRIRKLFVPLLGVGALAPAVLAGALMQDRQTADEPIILRLKMDTGYLGPAGPMWGDVPLIHNQLNLTTQRPASVKKEPVYKGTPRYATFRAGNGPHSEYVVALDEPANLADFRIYIDLNRNGDLTDDGDGKWATAAVRGDAGRFGPHPVVVNASWGSDVAEVFKGEYGFIFYRTGAPGEMPDTLTMRRQAARVGEIELDGKKYKAMLVENDSDGVYAKPLNAEGKPLNGRPSRGVELAIDLNGNGTFERSEYFDVRGTIAIQGKAFRPRLTLDGSQVQLWPSAVQPGQPIRVDPQTARPVVERPSLLGAGEMAPDFEVEKPNGAGKIKLSDFRGKVVIIDFWASWCGPCKRAMPFVQALYDKTRSQGVEVFGVCVWDERDAFEKFVSENKQYTFQKAFDTHQRAPTNVATSLYKVSGIPTMYVIDRDGKVIEGIVGFRGETDTRLADALKRAGITVD
jgi:thiol-disulfide isomerase/thioredoxin